MKIKKVIICGLGALGLTYANKLKDVCELKILANSERIEKYKKNIPTLNGQNIELDYILPDAKWNPDLIIISTKSTDLNTAIDYIKNFVTNKTIIISLINGISSEEIISKNYPEAKVLRSYFIGHSAIKSNNNVTQDGIGKIVFEPNIELENFFKDSNIDYEIADDIIYSQWLKLGINVILNQPSAIYNATVGELRNMPEYLPLAKKLLREVKEVAIACGVKNLENFETEVLESANLVANDGKTSMYQDILAKRKTEVDIFAGEIIRLGKKFGIKTTENIKIYNQIKNLESKWK